MPGYIIANPPTNQIYDFKGVYVHDELTSNNKESLSLENTLWANTVLASSGYILGMVIFTGIETRSIMNSK